MPPLLRSWITPFLLAACAAGLTGCGNGDSLARTFGFIHDAPDEFAVTTAAPLSMPPTFSLPPPKPGALRPQEQSEAARAQEALVPAMALGGPPPSTSAGQQALVQEAGPPAPADIRAEVDQQALQDRPSQSFWAKLRFWQTPDQPGIVVDAPKEAQRLRQNAALGESPDAGDTPIIQPKQRGWLQGIF
jgi:hypothetical protein